MRAKGLYLIETLIKNKKYLIKDFRKNLIKNGLQKEKISQLYKMYRENRDKKPISAHSLSYGDIDKLYNIVLNMLEKVKRVWAKQK